MDNISNATLILYSSLLTAGSTNSYGTSNTLRTEMLFTNINMKVVMGDLYDSYSLFNISLQSVIIPLTTTTSAGTTDSDRKLIVYMSGLGWINNSYNFANRCNSSSASVGTIAFAGSQPSTGTGATVDVAQSAFIASIQAPCPIYATFGKNDDVINIGITYKCALYVSGSNAPISANAYPAVAFIFKINGVPAYNGDGRINITSKSPAVDRRIQF